MTNDLRHFVDERTIERQLIYISRAMDERDWAALGELMFDDATADI